MDNLRRWDDRSYPKEPGPISMVFDDRIIGVADATKLCENPELTDRWDLLIVNLPHRTIEMLSSLAPLLNRKNISMVRGRVIAPESGIEEANHAIRTILPDTPEGFPDPILRIKSDYSSKLRLCSFHAWVAPMDE